MQMFMTCLMINMDGAFHFQRKHNFSLTFIHSKLEVMLCLLLFENLKLYFSAAIGYKMIITFFFLKQNDGN